MAYPKHHISVSEHWLNKLEEAAQRQASIASFEVLNLISHIRGLTHNRDQAIAEMEIFKRGLPPLSGAVVADHRDAWARLGWIVA